MTDHRDSLKIFIVAGEHSGDALGGALMAALKAQYGGRVLRFAGVGGAAMEAQGLRSIFPIEDVAVMGPLSILPALPRIIRRVYQTVADAVRFRPDAVIIIDSPEFTHPIAKRIRRALPGTPIVNYVSPSVWAWRPGRANRMRGYIDHVLALLPFEPAAHLRLGGPPCTYVGHPLIEKFSEIRNADAQELAQRLGFDATDKVLLVLPGSRRSEVARLIGVFGDAVALLAERGHTFTPLIPAVAHVRPLIEDATKTWRIAPVVIDSAGDKYAAMRLAQAALAASGTVTLELALAGTPSAVAYKVDAFMARMRFLLNVPSVVLANLVLEKNVYPELLQDECTAENLADALAPLLDETPARAAQLLALAETPARMDVPGGRPSLAAARVVADVIANYADGKSRRG